MKRDILEERAFNRSITERLETLLTEHYAKAELLSAAIKAQVASGDQGRPNETVRGLVKEGRKLQADFLRQVRILQKIIGISEKEMRALERARDAEILPPGDDRRWRTEIEEFPLSESQDLDEHAKTGVERLLARVNRNWLRTESQKAYRLGSTFLNSPLHLVNGVRVGLHLDTQVPQRFARMLLVTLDYSMNRDDFDFFSASMFVPEIAQLGNSLRTL